MDKVVQIELPVIRDPNGDTTAQAAVSLFLLSKIMPVSVLVPRDQWIETSEWLGALGFSCWVDLAYQIEERQLGMPWNTMGFILVTDCRLGDLRVEFATFEGWTKELAKLGEKAGPEFQQRAMEVAKGGIP